MLAAIAGDIIGSGFERSLFRGNTFGTAVCSGYDVLEPRVDRTGESAKDFRFFVPTDTFTDDSVYLVAIMDWLLGGKNLSMLLRKYYRQHPDVGWGAFVKKWARSTAGSACGSFGNGAAMRVTAIGHFAASVKQALSLAHEQSIITHSVPHAIAGAEAIAMGVFLARTGEPKEKILARIGRKFRYELETPLDAVRPFYAFTSLSTHTVPLAFRAFFEGRDFESVVRRAVSVGGDSDTIASMAGGLAGAYYGVPNKIRKAALSRLPRELAEVTKAFESQFLQAPPFPTRL